MDVDKKRESVNEQLQNSAKTGYDLLMQSESIHRKEWRYTGDKNNFSEHCRNHASMDGVVIPKADSFELIGLDGKKYYPKFPRDPILPEEERISCVCFLQGITSDSMFGMTYEERKHRTQQYINDLADERPDWEKELDAKNRAKAGIEPEGMLPTRTREMQIRAPEGYKLLEEANLRLDKLERNFRKDVEGSIVEALAAVKMIPGVSTYQQAITLKRLADCYYANEHYHEALDYYTAAHLLYDKLPVKRRIEELTIMTGGL